jgi:hypothetical protein
MHTISIYGSTVLVGLGRFFSFLIYTQPVRLLGWGISPSQGSYLHTEQHKNRINTQTSVPRVGFELTITVFERAKAVHDFDRAAAVIDMHITHIDSKEATLLLMIMILSHV